MTTFLLTAALLWLLVLTILYASMVGHLNTLEPHAALSPPEPEARAETGFPAEAAAALARAGFGADDFAGLILSSTCRTCRSLARGLAGEHVDPARTVVLVTGSRESGITELRRILAPSGLTLVLDPDAGAVAGALDATGTPFAFRISAGVVIATAYPRRAANFRTLADLAGRPPAEVERR